MTSIYESSSHDLDPDRRHRADKASRAMHLTSYRDRTHSAFRMLCLICGDCAPGPIDSTYRTLRSPHWPVSLTCNRQEPFIGARLAIVWPYKSRA
jgi:hypothetical protein